MKLKYKKLTACLALLGVVQFSTLNIGVITPENSSTVHAASSQTTERILQQKATTDTNKAWSINFNSEVDLYSIKDCIQVNEINNDQIGSTIPVTISQGSGYSIVINPPSGGYKKGQMYQVTIKKDARARNGKGMVRNNNMKFSIGDANTAIAKVEISPVVSMIKAITINATTRTDIKKYKIEGNDNLFDIGETSVNVLDNKSSIQVYFYGADGYTMLGKTTLNVNSNISDTILQIQ